MSLFWRVPSKIFSTIYLEIAWNLSNTGKKNQNEDPTQKQNKKKTPNQAKEKQTKIAEEYVYFVDR